MKLGFITVDYDDGNPASYRGILASIHVDGRQDEDGNGRFVTGDFETDKTDAIDWLREKGCEKIFGSSTIDNFVADSSRRYV